MAMIVLVGPGCAGDGVVLYNSITPCPGVVVGPGAGPVGSSLTWGKCPRSGYKRTPGGAGGGMVLIYERGDGWLLGSFLPEEEEKEGMRRRERERGALELVGTSVIELLCCSDASIEANVPNVRGWLAAAHHPSLTLSWRLCSFPCLTL